MNKKTRPLRLSILTLLVVALFPALSSAQLVTVDFEGEVTSIDTLLLGDGVNLGTKVTGQFSYTIGTTDSNVSPDMGIYSIDSYSISIGSSFNASSTTQTLRLQNDQMNGSATSPADGLTVGSSTGISADTLNGQNLSYFQMGLRNENTAGQLWTNDSLPGMAFWNSLDVNSLTGADWNWLRFDDNLNSQLRFELTSVSAGGSNSVPEPSTTALIGVGLLVCICILKRSRSSKN